MIAFIHWNPAREAFSLPFFDWPIYWYSLWFALGFYGAIVVGRSLIRSKALYTTEQSEIDWKGIDHFIETLSVYAFVGMLIGSRLGHVLFYDLSFYLSQPLEIVKVWHGGLSSHGGVAGLLVAIWFFSQKKQTLPYLPRGADLLDLMAIASAWTAGCIRVGNFFNQEIVGTISSLPWAVVFGSPQDGTPGVPRHPAQLYEALSSFILLTVLLIVARRGHFARNGQLAGWYLLITFSIRSLVEFVKVDQCSFDALYLHMGQLLSLPVIFFALFLIIQARVMKQEGQSEHRHEKKS